MATNDVPFLWFLDPGFLSFAIVVLVLWGLHKLWADVLNRYAEWKWKASAPKRKEAALRQARRELTLEAAEIRRLENLARSLYAQWKAEKDAETKQNLEKRVEALERKRQVLITDNRLKGDLANRVNQIMECSEILGE